MLNWLCLKHYLALAMFSSISILVLLQCILVTLVLELERNCCWGSYYLFWPAGAFFFLHSNSYWDLDSSYFHLLRSLVHLIEYMIMSSAVPSRGASQMQRWQISRACWWCECQQNNHVLAPCSSYLPFLLHFSVVFSETQMKEWRCIKELVWRL